MNNDYKKVIIHIAKKEFNANDDANIVECPYETKKWLVSKQPSGYEYWCNVIEYVVLCPYVIPLMNGNASRIMIGYGKDTNTVVTSQMPIYAQNAICVTLALVKLSETVPFSYDALKILYMYIRYDENHKRFPHINDMGIVNLVHITANQCCKSGSPNLIREAKSIINLLTP